MSLLLNSYQLLLCAALLCLALSKPWPQSLRVPQTDGASDLHKAAVVVGHRAAANLHHHLCWADLLKWQPKDALTPGACDYNEISPSPDYVVS